MVYSSRTSSDSNVENENSWDGETYIYNGGIVHRQDKKKIGHVIVSDFVTKIENQAFERCKLLESIEFASLESSSLKEIGNRAFFECESLQSMVLPLSVEKVGKKAFFRCKKLKSPFLSLTSSSSLPSSLRIIEKDAFYGCNGLERIEIPQSVEKLGMYAFGYCTNLISVKFAMDSKIKEIPNCGFDSCFSLRTIILPDGIEVLGAESFSWCKTLKSIRLPNSLKVIRKDTFVYCRSLEYIVIPPSVEGIGAHAFWGCGFTSIEIPGLSIDSPSDGSLDSDTVDKKDNAESHFRTIRLPQQLQDISKDAFEKCQELEDLIDWQKIYFLCDTNRIARKFLQTSIDSPVALRPYVLSRKQITKKRSENAVSKELSEDEGRIRHASYLFYLLLQDAAIWQQQSRERL